MMTETIGPGYVRKTHWFEHLVRSPWFWVAFLTFGFSFPIYKSIYRTLPPELPIIAHVPEFELISENGKPFGSNDLKGRIYLATFAFTRCPTVCPKMLSDLEKIQKRVRGTGHKVALVTFTVDPDHDTPEVLFKTARDRKANPHVWTFLTGKDKESMFKLYKDGFKVGAEHSTNIMEIAHSEKIVLVDDANRIRGYYPFEEHSINQLMIDVGLLINRPSTKE